MNATSLYVSTCRVMLGGGSGAGGGGGGAGGGGVGETADLFRLLPYLRAALSCAVCGGLLRRAASPPNGSCPHAVCRGCRFGRKRLKPACPACRDLHGYYDNRQLRILLQSYKRLCEYFIGTEVYRQLAQQTEDAAAGLVDLIREGAGFSDGYESTAGLSKSAYSILPCVYTNSSTQTQGNSQSAPPAGNASDDSPTEEPPPSRPSNDGSPLYSVMYAGTGNKITIKRKPPDEDDGRPPREPPPSKEPTNNQSSFKKPAYRSRNSGNKRKGCRCGNATATPGKLTCCGQRCPCYVESKPCNECKCKGCRNPHRADGLKVRPHIPQLDNNFHLIPIKRENSPSGSGSMESLEADSYEMGSMDNTINFDPRNIKTSNIDVYTSRLQEVSADLPAAIMMDEDVSPSSPASDEDSGSPRLRDGASSPPMSQRSLMLPVHNIFIPFRRASPCLSHQDNNSDIEVDV